VLRPLPGVQEARSVHNRRHRPRRGVNIHYYQQFFPGECSPGSLQPFALASTLARRGHNVTVISAKYNIDSGADEPEVDRATGAGRLRVLRLDCHRGGRRSNISRLRAYVGFMTAARRKGRRLERPNIVVGSIQPIFTGWAAWKNAQAAGVPFVLEIRDLWPDALVVKKAISPLQARPLHWMVNTLYKNAARIVSLTPGIKQELVKKGIPGSKIDVFPNGFNPALFDVGPQTRDQVRRKYGWGDDFVAIYTGSFQEVTAVEVYVRAAASLRDRPGIRLALFGAGPTREAVGKLAAGLNVNNLEFHDPVPKKDVPQLLAAADVGLMALFRSPLVHIYFENKLMDYMGAGLPILAAMEGPQARMIMDSKAGRVVETFDHEELARLILELSQDAPARRQMGEDGRRTVMDRLLLPEILKRYADTVEASAQGLASEHPVWEPL
jgi:glycosyltransferase involved in cell wall biosynthesis